MLRRRPVLTPLVLLYGCSAGDSAAAPPPEPGGSSPASAPVESEPDPPPPPGDEITLTGMVGQTGIGCGSSWQAVEPTIGRVRVLGPGATDLKPGEVVIARGHATEPPPPPDLQEPEAECPVPQMRSDYEETPMGMMIRREPAPGIAAFQASTVERVTVFEARAHKESVKISMHDVFDRPLRQAEIRIHYEGCYGKPGHMQIERKLDAFEPGATQDFTFPLLQTKPARGAMRPHRAASVQLVSRDPKVISDLDVDLSALGVAFECPRKGGHK